ncbi:hypothetical protein AMEX_G24707 [Astyanax mexicanus]|uniref:Ig-like domain-containing protein n=1 Tax=Astyanax mexicanus TaxID=7994 RepID=A0A8T2L0J1_ASTMX|nr:hypothetical protein AMEX_G24707 [Astyanax mexicanus]
MKTLLIFTLYLISGPVGSVDVIGYSGGTVIMTCKWNRLTKSFCKTSPSNTCESTIYTTDRGRWFNRDRLYLFEEFYNQLVVLYRRLVPEDTGSYQCAESGRQRYTINLRVKSDPCCLGPTNMTGHLGETITISCSYPEEFQTEKKYLYKLEGPDFSELISTSESQKNRVSISEDRSSRVVRVRIRDVREKDQGDYFCGVKFDGQAVNYVSLFNEVQLQVAASASSVIIITVSICVVLLLIGGITLIYYKLRYSKTKATVSPTTSTGPTNATDGDYMIMRSRPAPARFQSTTVSMPKPTSQIQSTIASTSKPTNQILPTRTALPKPTNQIQPTKISTIYANDQIRSTATSTSKPNDHILSNTASTPKPTNQIHPVKASTPKPIIASTSKSTNQIHPVKATNPKPINSSTSKSTNQIDPVKATTTKPPKQIKPITASALKSTTSLNPRTNQSDSVYQSLNPNTDQSDSVYQSLNPNTNQSD